MTDATPPSDPPHAVPGYGLEATPTSPRPTPLQAPADASPRPRLTSAGGVVDEAAIRKRVEAETAEDHCFCGYPRRSLEPSQPCPECGRILHQHEPPMPETSVFWPIVVSLLCSPVTGPIAAFLAVTANEKRARRQWADAMRYRRWSHRMIWASLAQGVLLAFWVANIAGGW